MKKILLLTIFVAISATSQTIRNNSELENDKIKIDITKNTIKIIELDKVVYGIGPSGNISRRIASNSIISKKDLKAYPEMKNIPDSLSEVKEYCYILNKFQFYYQNYRNGTLSKHFFIKRAEMHNWDLNDTILLSPKTIHNYISVVAGIDTKNNPVCIIDTNNNHDYSDEIVKPLLSRINKQAQIIENCEKVDIEYYDGNSVKKATQAVSLKNGRSSDGISISFQFPQFRYTKVNFNNETYLFLSESQDYLKSIYVVKDQPNFSRLGREQSIEPSQYLKIEDSYIKYTPISQDNSKIKLTINNNDFKNKTTPISNQIGMIAPIISGVDILNGIQVSTEKHKGKYIFLDFWSNTCAPCIKEFPNIKEIYDTYSENVIEIIGIVEVRGKIKLKEFLVEKDVTWLNIDNDDSLTIADGYNIYSYPTTYLIDPNGKIIATNLRGEDLKNKLELLKLPKK